MISVGGDINKISRNGVSSLHLACAAGRLSMIEFLINEQKLDPEDTTKASGSKPIHLATNGGHLEVVQYLIEEHGCDPTVRDANKEDCLTLAVKSKRRDVAKYLINSGKFDITKIHEEKGFNYFAYSLVKGQ